MLKTLDHELLMCKINTVPYYTLKHIAHIFIYLNHRLCDLIIKLSHLLLSVLFWFNHAALPHVVQKCRYGFLLVLACISLCFCSVAERQPSAWAGMNLLITCCTPPQIGHSILTQTSFCSRQSHPKLPHFCTYESELSSISFITAFYLFSFGFDHLRTFVIFINFLFILVQVILVPKHILF